VKRPDDASSFAAKSRLYHVVNALGAALPRAREESIRELVDVGEGTVALENLAGNLHEFDIPVPAELLAELRALAAELNARGPFGLLRSVPP